MFCLVWLANLFSFRIYLILFRGLWIVCVNAVSQFISLGGGGLDDQLLPSFDVRFKGILQSCQRTSQAQNFRGFVLALRNKLVFSKV